MRFCKAASAECRQSNTRRSETLSRSYCGFICCCCYYYCSAYFSTRCCAGFLVHCVRDCCSICYCCCAPAKLLPHLPANAALVRLAKNEANYNENSNNKHVIAALLCLAVAVLCLAAVAASYCCSSYCVCGARFCFCMTKATLGA